MKDPMSDNMKNVAKGSFSVNAYYYDPYADKMDAGIDQPIY
jgi:hypothetical protein